MPTTKKQFFYAEYKNTGDGAKTEKRVRWSKQLTDIQVRQYTLPNIFSLSLNKNEPAYNWFHDIPKKSFARAAFTKKTQPIIPLYKIVPNNKPVADKENLTVRDNVTRIAKVSNPTLTVFKPERPNGKAVIICPGGGYLILAFDKEGTRVAEEFNKWGVTAFVLKYRLPDDSINVDRSLAPLQDAQQAIRFVRNNANEFGVDKNKIGIMGFSAGGHLASTAATHFNFKADASNSDTTSVRPDFAILIYPVISFDTTFGHKGSRNNLIGPNAAKEKTDFYSNELQVTATTPPVFLIHAGDDATVPVENSIRFYQACINNKVPAELHLYLKGGHGFGMYNKTTDDNWMERLKNWLSSIK